MRRTAILAVLAVSAIALVSCSSSDDGGPSGPDAGAPTVSSMSITDGETDVGLVGKITAMFSEPMDPSTINDTTFVVAGRSAVGYVEYDESTHTVSFLPDTLLASETWHNLVITDDVTDAGGTPYAGSETSFQTGAVTCDNLTDHMEPNDTTGEATPIELDRTYYTLTGCGNDTDLFEFTITGTTRVVARATFRRAESELCYVYLKRGAGEDYSWAGRAVESGEYLGASFTFLPGTYYAEVIGRNGYEGWVLYEFRISTEGSPCPDDEFEDNDFFDEATSIIPGTYYDLRGCYVDADYFAVQADSGEVITASVETQEGTGNRDLNIYGPGEDLLVSEYGSESPLVAEATSVESGTHYVYVRYSASNIVYDMTVGVTD